MKQLVGLGVFTLVLAFPLWPNDQVNSAKRLTRSAQVLREMLSGPNGDIPEDLLNRAQCVVVIPDMKRGALIVGARYGAGFAACRTNSGWSAPAGVQIEGGSLGAQVGATETDLLVFVMERNARDRLLKDKLTLGATASVQAGPVGSAGSTANLDAILWARTTGAFAELSVHGARLEEDNSANQALYGRKVSAREILDGEVTAPTATYAFEAALRQDEEK